MARTKNQSCIHICLDEKTYIVLRQKAAYKNISMSAYLKDLSLNVVMTTYEIGVHDLSDMNSKLDFLTFKASGYYRLVTARDRNQLEVRADDGDRMINLFKKLSEFMEECYEKLVVNRQSDMSRERELLSKAINSAPKSTYRKSDVWVSVPAIKDVILTVTQEEKEKIYTNAGCSQKSSRDISRYFRDLILSNRYIKIRRKTEDLNLMVERLYSALMYGKPFITMMKCQGYEYAVTGRELELLYTKVRWYEKEIWNIVENDRRAIYEEYDLKIHGRLEHRFERRRSRKEEASCQY